MYYMVVSSEEETWASFEMEDDSDLLWKNILCLEEMVKKGYIS